MEIGKTNFDGNTRKRFKIQDGDNVYRILPPLGSLASKGKYSLYQSVVWGYKASTGKNAPFQDCRVRNFKTKMIEVESEAYLRSEKLKAELKNLKERVRAGEAVDPTLVKRMEDLVGTFNIENKHYLNVVNLKGEIGLLKIGPQAKKLLDVEIKKLIEKGIDPTSVENGRFFNFFRSGRMLDTTYQVTVYREQRELDNGEVVESPKTHKMDENFIARLNTEAFDLGKLYPTTTEDQVKRIVAGEYVDVVLGLESAIETEDDTASDDEASTEQMLSQVSTPKAEVETQAEVKAPKAEVKPTEVKPTQTASATNAANNLSDEEFLKSMGM